MRYGMVIDLKKCIGCRSCVVACKVENVTPPGIFWGDVVQREWGTYPNVRRVYLPRPCMHCEDPLCLAVCPSGATQQRSDGIVWIDNDLCIGCRACVVACPYEARYFYGEEKSYFPQGPTPLEERGYQKHKVGTTEKCNFCMERVDAGLEPACVVTCLAVARYFGDLDDPKSEVSQLITHRFGFQLHPDSGCNPKVFYLPP